MPSASETVDLCPLFASLGAKDRARVAADLRERRYTAGDAMTSEDHGGVAFFLIGEGEATVSVAGRGAVKRLGPGDYFGEMALIDESPRSADAITNTSVVLGSIAKATFEDLLFMNKDLAHDLLWTFVRTLSTRLRETNEKMRAFLVMAGKF